MKRTTVTSKLIFTALVFSAATVIAQQPAVKRSVLHQQDLSTAGREVVMAKAEFPKGGATGRHTHPGEESSYVAAGTIALEVEGVTKTYKAGESFFVPAGKVHNAVNSDAGESVVIANYIVEKGKPLTTPVK